MAPREATAGGGLLGRSPARATGSGPETEGAAAGGVDTARVAPWTPGGRPPRVRSILDNTRCRPAGEEASDARVRTGMRAVAISVLRRFTACQRSIADSDGSIRITSGW